MPKAYTHTHAHTHTHTHTHTHVHTRAGPGARATKRARASAWWDVWVGFTLPIMVYMRAPTSHPSTPQDVTVYAQQTTAPMFDYTSVNACNYSMPMCECVRK